ncbi:putative aldouronate transport system permease protein [Paenibacillus sp. 1_12]|uniref:carbohydrate ABC transporter permease n=1 Tax=Paenibacillus sp. 1_12 TaxID=1566278 RepID=UPI0008DFB1F5|nr:carbohydrate ABC transporter permease [Paenibacillus sp. 1_12]SFM17615.1 putative aldouronate transport system permease protein [Paenibacillus sp. 1_12]
MNDTKGESLFYVVNYIVMTLVALSCLLPIINIFAVSVSNQNAVASGFVSLWPIGFNLDSYKALLKGTNIVLAFQNSVVITLVGVLLSMLFTIMAAYPLSRKYFWGRKFFTMAMVFTMLFSGGLIPTYLLVKSLGLVNSYGALWLPGLISTYNMLVMRTFFDNIPVEVEEAARIDGCGELRLLGQIIMPLSLPVVATLALFYGVGFWNAFMSVLIYINDTKLFNLTVLVQKMVQSQQLLQQMNNLQPDDVEAVTPNSIKSAAIIIMIAPMLVVYPFVQKYFVKGVMIGSVKG